MGDVSFEGFEVRDTVFDELGSDELTGRVPFTAIGCEDTVAQEWKPLSMEIFALAYV